MIDIELDIFNACASALETEYQGIFVTNRLTIGMPSEFPSVCLSETSNRVAERYIDSSGVEQASELAYVADIFSNKRVGAKQEARAILATLDEVLYALNFTRKRVDQYAYEDGTIFRIVARYEAVVDRELHLYRR